MRAKRQPADNVKPRNEKSVRVLLHLKVESHLLTNSTVLFNVNCKLDFTAGIERKLLYIDS